MQGKEILFDKTDQAMRFLFKNFLNMLEEIKKEHDNNFDKLYEALPEEHYDLLDMADYFDETKYEIYRKRILDIGNDILRNHLGDFEKFEIHFTFKE